MHKRSYPPFFSLLLTAAICAALAVGCAKKPNPEFKEATDLYYQNKLAEALPLFTHVATEDKSAEAYAYLAESYRRLGQTDKAVTAAREALDINRCDSFAHTVLAAAYNPMYGSWEQTNADTTWAHLMRAVRCDSTDGDAWSWIWSQAVRRGDRAMEKRALRRMMETGFLTPPVVAYNRWMMRYLPEDALLLTSGDWDTYPAEALQQVDNFRPDVAVVNLPLLNTTWYAEYLRNRYSLPLPFSDEELADLKPKTDDSGHIVTVAAQVLDGWLDMSRAGSLTRPIAVSVTVSPNVLMPALRDSLLYMGSFLIWQPQAPGSPADTTAMQLCLSSVNPEDFAGPFFSPGDRSPIRVMASNGMVDNVTVASLRLAQAQLKAGLNAEALKQLTWTEKFMEKTEWKSPLADGLKKLMEAAKAPANNKPESQGS
jgi:tetratricopeptide (TPR) repeat protein